MKIVHVSHLYHPSEGGVQFWFKNVSERLVKNYGDDVTIVTTNSYYGPERKIFKKVIPAEEVINGVKIKRFSYTRFHISPLTFFFKICKRLSIPVPGWLSLIRNGPYSREMKRFLMNANASAICGSPSNYWFMQLPLWKKCNFCYFGSIHLSKDESKPVLNQKQLQCINASSVYIANTQYEKARLVRAGVEASKIVVLGVGVDENAFERDEGKITAFRNKAGLKDDDLLITYVGRIERTKSVLVLIKSFEKLAACNSKVHLLIAGSGGEYAEELKQYCSQLPINTRARIQWKENFPLEEKATLFNALDILVLPSANESFGIVFLEAWVCRKPVIGAAIGAVKDVITENSDGLLMEVDDPESLSVQLTKLINDAELRRRLGLRGYEKVMRNYTWDKIVARLRQCYEDGQR